ncbi:hypothetical protein V6C42_12940 [Pseudoclostridium thermosuccinogenes]|uniref:hypothetical protein n=1 Tax=Clostridium thermosuccinogenes TaxID=84032 RepID=UPI002FD87D92
MLLKKLCRCGTLIDAGRKYCSSCERKYQQEKAEANRYYDKNIRDKKAAAFYNSPEWETTRKYVLAKYKGLDLYAFFIEKKIAFADTVHHIEELRDNWDRRLDITNLIPLSSSNHNRIHSMYEKDKVNTQNLLFGLRERWRETYEG